MKKIRIILFVCIGALTYSCVPYKDLLILQSNDKKAKKMGTDSLFVKPFKEVYRLQPGDILSIDVSSTDAESEAIFNKEVSGKGVSQLNEVATYITGYQVSDSGAIKLPIVGKIDVVGLTISEADAIIESRLLEFYKYISVDIKLTSFRVTILGEIRRPSTNIFYNENTSILQAIGKAGGFTDHSNRAKIKVIRTKGDKVKVKYINLQNSSIINSEFYYLQPNDVVFVEPLKVKTVKVNSPTIQLVLSTLTFIIVLSNLVRNP